MPRYRTLSLQAAGEVVKAASGKILGGYFFNQATEIRWLKIFNLADFPPPGEVSAMTLGIAAGQGLPLLCGPDGWTFDQGIAVSASTGPDDNFTGNPAASEVVGFIDYV